MAFIICIQFFTLGGDLLSGDNDSLNFLRVYKSYDAGKVSSIQSIRHAILPRIKENVQFSCCVDFNGLLACISQYQDGANVSYMAIWDDLGKDSYKKADVIILSKTALGFKDENAYLTQINNCSVAEKEKFNQDRLLRQQLVATHFLDGKAMELLYEDDFVYVFCKP